MKALEHPEANIRITDSTEEIKTKERLGEYVMLRFRLSEGISVREFYRLFGRDFDAMYGAKLARFIRGGFVERLGDSYRMTPKGMFISNYILSDLLDFSDVDLYDPMS